MAKLNGRCDYQLKITLSRSRPPIWRRVIVPDTMLLPEFHKVIQSAMGWEDYHLHEFNIGGQRFGVPDLDWPTEVINESGVMLNQIFSAEKQKIGYLYDFGDSWEHAILLEKILPRIGVALPPRCVTGKRACPPEDCGGIYGYYHLLDVLEDPQHPEHESLAEWADDEIDPEYFDLTLINTRLASLE
jgi:hypothetical protein